MKHQNFSSYLVILPLFVFFMFSSCGSKRDVVYFQNSYMIPEDAYPDNLGFKAKIMPNDNLFITVSAVNRAAVEIFNTVNTDRNISTASLDILGYLVDQSGNVNFPLVGNIHIGGLTKMEAIQLLQKEISKFVDNPVVNIRIMNYKISVLGEVARPGVYSITDEKISIPQAIAMAGDLTIFGQRRNIQLIRMEKGERVVRFIDLTSPDLFFSPDYYLRQNDVLYISPNSTKAGTSTYNQNLPLLVSLISVTITAVALFVRYK